MTLTSVAELDRPDPRSPIARMEALFDAGTITMIGEADRSGVRVAGGAVGGTPVIAFATDPARRGGAVGVDGCARIVEAIDLAVREQIPVVGVWHSGGALLPEGVLALDAVGLVFAAVVRASGQVPQISLVLGPAAGGAAYGPALTDIVVMSDAGRIFVTGPDVVHSVTGEAVDMATLGGPDVHARKSGVAHVAAGDEAAAVAVTRELVELLGRPGRVRVDDADDRPELDDFLPARSRRAYDVHPLITRILDSRGVELHAGWGRSMVTTLGRFAGRTVGVLANNPLRMGGCLDSISAEKAARFVRMCDALGVPLIVLVDVPGYLPGVTQEWDGVVRRGAKLLHAFAESVVPRVTLMVRKAYGGAYIAMNSRSLGATAVLAWPDAEVAVMGAGAAVNILHRKALAAAAESEREALHARLVQEQIRDAGGVRRAVEAGMVDAVIAPSASRRHIARALAAAPERRGRHGNIPL